ncbi:MAG TPA: HAMP domain-containing sensor histidine kinase [Burkholderiaceae bacterium]|nr:HAMP domain-containing sensor histidine kinase [Burkholderiaceae bacterium]
MIWRWPLARPGSLRWRVLMATLTGLTASMLLAGWLLSSLFKEHVTRQFRSELTIHLDQLAARLSVGPQGQPVMDSAGLTDPRWQRPLSGRYWQVDERRAQPTQAGARIGVLRSRSLWDGTLELPPDVVADGSVHTHTISGPAGQPLLVVERSVHTAEQTQTVWTLIVAADFHESEQALQSFNGMLTAALGAMITLLTLSAVAQVWVALSPMRALEEEAAAVSNGSQQRLTRTYPSEVQPLVSHLNAALDAQAEHLSRAKTQAGNLAHALKTPLAVMQHAADHALTDADASVPPVAQALAQTVSQQVELARKQVDWHLRRAQAAARAGLGKTSCSLWPSLASMVRVMGRVHADRRIRFDLPEPVSPPLAVEADEQDLHEMLGNLLDNACKWTTTCVSIKLEITDAHATVLVEDDGPGIPPSLRRDMLMRGVRLDESAPGSGLGLAIVNDLAHLYNGSLVLGSSSAGGLSAVLTLRRLSQPSDGVPTVGA